ncbi:MAG TPA: DUF2007 domain-containing protein [Rhodanobacteraceae bacterium]|nr:DUF2007 domain-containing protein [Rhodanobacteraceae bacterium]
MRQIYTSPRLHNIDRVVALMAEHGIETSVTDRSNYRHASYDRPSYTARDSGAGWPKVWVVHADDFTRARALMREIGIEPKGRHADPLPAPQPEARPQRRRGALALRIRLVLLATIALLMLLMVLRHSGIG